MGRVRRESVVYILASAQDFQATSGFSGFEDAMGFLENFSSKTTRVGKFQTGEFGSLAQIELATLVSPCYFLGPSLFVAT